MELDALAGQHAFERLGDFPIHAAKDFRQVFDDGDLGAEAAPDGAQFQADNAAADNDHGFWYPGKGQRAGGRNNRLLVDIDFDARHAGNIGAGGDNDVFSLDRPGFSVFAGDRNLAGLDDPAGTVECGDLVLFHQEGDAIDIGFHHRILVRHHRLEIEFRFQAVDAERRKSVAGFVIHFRGVQQRLGRDAADIEAGAAKGGAFFDNRHLQPKLRGLDCTNISARAGADDCDIEFLTHS